MVDLLFTHAFRHPPIIIQGVHISSIMVYSEILQRIIHQGLCPCVFQRSMAPPAFNQTHLFNKVGIVFFVFLVKSAVLM